MNTTAPLAQALALRIALQAVTAKAYATGKRVRPATGPHARGLPRR